jgi:hypothetical protein
MQDETSVSRRQMLARLDVCMGGRVAEELIFGEANVTSGASSDIAAATRTARQMVTKYGMSKAVGVVELNYEDDGKSLSTETRQVVEHEVKLMLQVSRAAVMTHSRGGWTKFAVAAGYLLALLAGWFCPVPSLLGDYERGWAAMGRSAWWQPWLASEGSVSLPLLPCSVRMTNAKRILTLCLCCRAACV